MHRRTFIANASLFTLGTLLSSPLYASFAKHSANSFDGKVIIVGAGAAGLYAGHLLKAKGIDFQLLEASERYGGRLGKLENFADFPLDRGAQWLHGKRSLLKKIIKKSKTEITKDNSDVAFWFNERFTEKLPVNVYALLRKGRDLPDISFLEHASQKGLGDEYRYILEQMAGDQGADPALLSVKWNFQEEYEWSAGRRDYKFRNTFYDLIDQNIANGITDAIRLNTPVAKIDYHHDTVIISDRLGNEYQANKVIVTAPISILQAGDIQFSPPLPTNKVNAFGKIGMGAGMKVFLKFKRKFYHENIVGGKICAAYADETVGKKGSDHILLAFIMGRQAERLTALGSNGAIEQALLDELDEMYKGKASESFLASHIENWTQHPFIRGAYSYSKVGIGNARKIAASPVENKIFFAGEAMNTNGHHQTVHGAMETALQQVDLMLKNISG